jgi:hypothetical protein
VRGRKWSKVGGTVDTGHTEVTGRMPIRPEPHVVQASRVKVFAEATPKMRKGRGTVGCQRATIVSMYRTFMRAEGRDSIVRTVTAITVGRMH